MSHELAVVMPVYNEEECVATVVQSWHDELKRLGMDFILLVINDGSRDGTAGQLARFADNDRVRVLSKGNSGHGPTILQGYRMAVVQADWVFQTDSDDEMSSKHFEELWRKREGYDGLFGYHVGRSQPLGRKLISVVSRAAVWLLFGEGVTDVNTPYRLIRSTVLSRIISHIPDGTFAPNIIISGTLAASRAALLNLPVHHEGRKTGKVSIVTWRLWRSSALSLFQVMVFSVKKVRL